MDADPNISSAPPARPDFRAFGDLVRETRKHLLAFVPPDDFVPEAVRPAPPVPSHLADHLGAPTLTDFYALALGQIPSNSDAPALFPHGPESIRPALTAVDREIARLTAKIAKSREGAARTLEETARVLTEGRQALKQAESLWLRLKKLALAWPAETQALFKKSLSLEKNLTELLKHFHQGQTDLEEAPSGRRRQSFAHRAARLKEALERALKAKSAHQRLGRALSALSADLDGLLAACLDSGPKGRDWAALKADSEKRLADLEKLNLRLAEETAHRLAELSQAQKALDQAEAFMGGRCGQQWAARLNQGAAGVQALLDTVLDRRRLLAKAYFIVPTAIGRPGFLEKTHLAAAAFLGRAQTRLENLERRLTLAAGRLSSAYELRRESDELAEALAALPPSQSELELAHHRLKAFSRAVDQRLGAEEALRRGQAAETALSQAMGENDELNRQLREAAEETDRLSGQLAKAARDLEEMGRMKARLLKVYDKKTHLLAQSEGQRLLLAEENTRLTEARDELKGKRSRLAAIYKREQGELKRLKAELNDQGEELALNRELLAAKDQQRREMESRLEAARQERGRLAAHGRQMEAKALEVAERLAEAGARAEGLSAQLDRHREELETVSRHRLILAERLSALRRKSEMLGRAQKALQKALNRQSVRLEAAENDRDRLSGLLSRRERSILRLVAAARRLRADLGDTRLKIEDLAQERDAIFAQLNEAQTQAARAFAERDRTALELDAAQKAQTVLKSRVGGLESENFRLRGRVTDLTDEIMGLTEAKLDLTQKLTAAEGGKDELARRLSALEGQVENDLTPLIAILGQALWTSQGRLSDERAEAARRLEKMKADSMMMAERLKLDGDVREANIRLKAAARELELGEAARAERENLAKNLEEKEGQLAQAQGQNATLEAEVAALKDGRADDFARNRHLLEAVENLGGRNKKLRRALEILGRRYGERLSEARRSESDLKGLIENQEGELIRQKNRLSELEPLVAHFMHQAEKSFGPGPEADLARQLRIEAEEMRDQAGRANRLNDELAARLNELEPLVAFLAKAFVTNVAELAAARQEREEMAERLTAVQAKGEVLEATLESRAGELAEVRSEAFALARERERLTEAAAEKEAQILTLKTALAQADRDLAENDGRLEAAWAGLNYLGAKAGDNLARMKARLENQTRQTDALAGEVAERDRRIQTLEERQDKLALLYWALASRAAQGTEALTEETLEIEEIEPVAEPPKATGGQAPQGLGFLDMAKRAARRSLFTLILAGGLIMGGSADEAGAQKNPNQLLSASLSSPSIGRAVSLEFVEPAQRLKGAEAVEKCIRQKADQLAAAHGLERGEFLRLVRQAAAPEDLVRLTDFEGPEAAARLLEKHLPRLSGRLGAEPLKARALLKAACAFAPGEGLFWERLFFNFPAKLSPPEAVGALLELLERKKARAALPPLEYAGRLAPFAEIENLGLTSFTRLLAQHLTKDLPPGRGRREAAGRLAADLYFAARLQRLPVTLLAPAAHLELAEGGGAALAAPESGTIYLYRLAEKLAGLARGAAQVWHQGRYGLCDLDDALAEAYGPAVEGLYQKKMKLIASYNKSITESRNLLSGLPSRPASGPGRGPLRKALV